MRYAEFYHNSTGWNGKDFSGPVKLIPACGSDSVLVLDARLHMARSARQARLVCRIRGYKGFTINAGENFARSNTIRKLEVI